jgi:hypothetical protein
MNGHSTAELKRQVEAAASRCVAANTAYANAKTALLSALVADRLKEHAINGIYPGSKVIISVPHWGGVRKDRAIAGFLGVEAVGYGYCTGDIFSKLKKDGTPSKARANFGTGTIEPYEGSPERASEVKP